MKFIKNLPVICMMLVAVKSNAQTPLQTSFETTQSYSVGNLAGQNNWTSTAGTVVVSTAKAKTGTQSVNMSANNATLKADYVAYSGSVPGITGEVYADMWFNPTSLSTNSIAVNGYDLYGSSSKRIFVVELTPANKIRAYTSFTPADIGTWTANQWVRISVKVDFSAQKYKVAVNGVVFATDFDFRESYTPTASGTRVAGIRELHSIRFNHLADATLATSDVAVDDIYVSTTPIPDVSFGASATTRTITVTQPAYGTIALNPSTGPYNLNQSVTANLTLPGGYMNNGWTGDLSGTSNSQTFTVLNNMAFSADVGIDASNPPPKYKLTITPPVNATITLSPYNADSMYYKETVVTATVSYEACYQLTGWTGDLAGGTAITKTFTVQNNMTFGVTTALNNAVAIKRTVSTVTEFKNALNAMNPGDTIEVNDGTYNLSSTSITRSGCELKPILVIAKNPGQVILNGATTLTLKKMKYFTLKGFQFQSTGIGTGIKLENCNKVRITGNAFAYTETASCVWILIGDVFASPDPPISGWNRIDHNSFTGKTQPGNFIRFDGNIDQITRYDTVDHNLFKNNGPRVDNGQESIRIGVSTLSHSSAYATIEYNLFEDCDGDPEIISVKSSDNTIRSNTFVRCLGTVCLRQGFRSVVEGNYFFGDNKTAVFNGGTIGCGGLRIYAKDHKIFNNYFYGLTGVKWDAAITITNGDVTNSSTSTSDHYLPENLQISFNTLINNASNIEIGFPNNGSYPLAPINNLIANNIVKDNLNPIVKSWSSTSLAGVAFSNNIMYPTGTSSIGITTTAAQVTNIDPQLIQPACQGAGCNLTNSYNVFRLNSTSPAINAAAGDFSYVTRDFEQRARTGLKDIGAHEYNGDYVAAAGALDEAHVGPAAVGFSYSYAFAIVVPVQLEAFNVVYANSVSNISWRTGEEVNIAKYEVEWSTDGNKFEKIKTVAAANAHQYNCIHEKPVTGKNYYRLKIIGNDGSIVYSAVRMINIVGKIAVSVYPNPAHGFVKVELAGAVAAGTELRLINTAGIIVKKITAVNPGVNNIPVGDLAAGIYLVQLLQSDGQKTNCPVSFF